MPIRSRDIRCAAWLLTASILAAATAMPGAAQSSHALPTDVAATIRAGGLGTLWSAPRKCTRKSTRRTCRRYTERNLGTVDARKTPKLAPSAPSLGKDPDLLAPWEPGVTLVSGGSCGDMERQGAHRDYGGLWTDDRYAVDFGVCGDGDLGLQVVAAHSGFVKVVKNDPDYGWTVVIERSNNDLATRYAHLAPRPIVRLGVHVTAGEVIGRIGYSGLGVSGSERAHLHFVAYGNRRAHSGRHIATVAGRDPCDGCEIDAPPDPSRGPLGPLSPPPPPPPPPPPLPPGLRVETLSCVPSSDAVGLASMPVTGTGFSPGAAVTLRSTSSSQPVPAVLSTITADAVGNFSAVISPPPFNSSSTQEQTFGLSATDGTNPALVASTTFKQVRVGYTTDPPTGRPTRSSVHTVRGFPAGKAVYLHFRFGGQTKVNPRLGVAAAPCGIASRRMALLPTTSHPGKWTVYADQAATYSQSTTPQLKYTFVITRTSG